MLDKSQREKIRLQFLQRLRQDNNVRAVLPRDFYDNLKDEDIAELDDYILLAQHRRYLSNKKKMAQSETEKKQLLNEIFTTQQYMLIAKFGDKNIGRFTNI